MYTRNRRPLHQPFLLPPPFLPQNSLGGLDHFRVLAHAHVVIAAPHGHVSPLLVRHVGVRVVLGRREVLGFAGQHTKPPVGVVLPLGLQLAVKEGLIIEFAT